MIASFLLTMLLTSAREGQCVPCEPLTLDEKAVVAAVIDADFATPTTLPFGYVPVVLNRTDNWLPVDLPQDFAQDGVSPVTLSGLQAINACPAALLDDLSFPSYDGFRFDGEDQEGEGPQCVSVEFGLPVTVVWVSRPYVFPSGESALVAIGQRHSWNHCGLWYIARLEREGVAWVVVGSTRLTLW